MLTVYDTVVKKVVETKQAPNIVVNLADSKLSISDVAQFLQRNPVRGLESLIIIRDGKVFVF